jgi:hypothetical protein
MQHGASAASTTTQSPNPARGNRGNRNTRNSSFDSDSSDLPEFEDGYESDHSDDSQSVDSDLPEFEDDYESDHNDDFQSVDSEYDLDHPPARATANSVEVRRAYLNNITTRRYFGAPALSCDSEPEPATALKPSSLEPPVPALDPAHASDYIDYDDSDCQHLPELMPREFAAAIIKAPPGDPGTDPPPFFPCASAEPLADDSKEFPTSLLFSKSMLRFSVPTLSYNRSIHALLRDVQTEGGCWNNIPFTLQSLLILMPWELSGS